MKNLTVLIFISIFGQSYSQAPDYFGNNPIWICSEMQDGLLAAGCYMNYDHKYFVAGDTTIGSYSYKKIRQKGWSNEDGWCYTPKDYYDEYLFGLRQAGKKIFINEAGQDSLFVDYDLNIGDTLTPCYLMPNPQSFGYENLTVQSIDSLQINGDYHKRFHFEFYGFTDTIPYYLLEGIGIFSDNGMSGLLKMELIVNEPFEWTGRIDCYLQSGISYLGTGPCDLSWFDFNLGIHEYTTQNKTVVKVFDLMGRKVDPTSVNNQVLIFYYSDGSAEKRFVVE